MTEDGTLVYPPGQEPGPKLPLVLVIHGGPQAASTTSFFPQAQSLTARGYPVFSPNYRGNDTLGNGVYTRVRNLRALLPQRPYRAVFRPPQVNTLVGCTPQSRAGAHELGLEDYESIPEHD